MSLDAALRSRIESLLQTHRIVLFMKGQPGMPHCGFSGKAASILDGLGVEYAHVNVLTDQEIREGIKQYGNWPTIPQLYIEGELIGGSDIIEQLADSGELNQLLGLPSADRTPPAITVTPTAAKMLQEALTNAGTDMALSLTVNPQFQTQLQIVPNNANAIATEIEGLRFQLDPISTRRADGITIDWIDDVRGKGLLIDNPNAPKID
jgi:monothiol glutaredoxin